MTDTAKFTPDPVCPEGDDFTELVTINEISMVARLLKCDPVTQIEQQGEHNWESMARLGWVLDRRRNPGLKYEDTWGTLSLPELLTAVGIPHGDTEDDKAARKAVRDEADAENPTAPAPA